MASNFSQTNVTLSTPRPGLFQLLCGSWKTQVEDSKAFCDWQENLSVCWDRLTCFEGIQPQSDKDRIQYFLPSVRLAPAWIISFSGYAQPLDKPGMRLRENSKWLAKEDYP